MRWREDVGDSVVRALFSNYFRSTSKILSISQNTLKEVSIPQNILKVVLFVGPPTFSGSKASVHVWMVHSIHSHESFPVSVGPRQVELMEAMFDWQSFWIPFNFMVHGARMLFGCPDR